MKCSVPSQNVKIIARAVNSMAKIGDEVFIEFSDDGMVFRTVNIAQSAFVEFRMMRSFFSAYILGDDDDPESGLKVTMKSFLSVFKNPHCMDKQVESFEIKMKSTGNVVVFYIKYANAHARKYYLPILENERLEANVPTGAPNGLTASSKFLSSAIKNFRHSEDEITLTVEKQKTMIKNHLEINKSDNFMRTELCFHPTEFEHYSVLNPTSITFCFKELRAVLAFAEPSGLPIATSFNSPGRPVLFKVENHPAYEANYVVSTLNSTNANVDSSLVGSQRVASGSQRDVSQRNATLTTRRSEEFNVCGGGDREERIEQMSVDAGQPVSRLQFAESNSSVAEMPPPGSFGDAEMMDVQGVEVTHHFPSRVDETEIPDSSIHSSYGSNSDVFNNASPASISAPSSNFSSKAQQFDEETDRLIKVVFARCMARNQNILNTMAEHKVVLASDSDPEQL